MKFSSLILLLFLVACTDLPYVHDVKESIELTQSAFFDLGAQYGAKCAFEETLAQLNRQPIADFQQCIKTAKKKYWQKNLNSTPQ